MPGWLDTEHSRELMMGWKHDLNLLASFYESWDDLAEEMRADVQGDWLRQVWKGRVIIDQKRDGPGIHYKQLPSEEVQEAITQHRQDLENAHRAAGKTAFRARQMIQRVLHEDPTEEELEAMQTKLQKMQDDLIWAD